MPPKLVTYTTEQEYKTHFERVYCQGAIYTFDSIRVYFKKSDFQHCMYESSKRNKDKDQFSIARSQRIDWIKATLESPHADLYEGWDKTNQCYDKTRRVAIVYQDYVVVIRISTKNHNQATFVTAYVADNSISKIRKSPKWKK
jgi:hypothetical protein